MLRSSGCVTSWLHTSIGPWFLIHLFFPLLSPPVSNRETRFPMYPFVSHVLLKMCVVAFCTHRFTRINSTSLRVRSLSHFAAQHCFSSSFCLAL